jgi:hypothetical protein
MRTCSRPRGGSASGHNPGVHYPNILETHGFAVPQHACAAKRRSVACVDVGIAMVLMAGGLPLGLHTACWQFCFSWFPVPDSEYGADAKVLRFVILAAQMMPTCAVPPSP